MLNSLRCQFYTINTHRNKHECQKLWLKLVICEVKKRFSFQPSLFIVKIKVMIFKIFTLTTHLRMFFFFPMED